MLQYLPQLEFGHPLPRVKLLTVQEMADIPGVTQESVSRIPADFKRRRILQKRDESLREAYHLNPELLRQETLLSRGAVSGPPILITKAAAIKKQVGS